MFANLIINGDVQGYRYNEAESLAAFGRIEKIAGFARALLRLVKTAPASFGDVARVVRA